MPCLARTRTKRIAVAASVLVAMLPLMAVPSVAAETLTGSAKASAPSGFTVFALVTADPDWLSKWDTPSPDVSIPGTDMLHAGDKATLAVFFSNPTLIDGKARLDCDVTIRFKSGARGKRLVPSTCFDGPTGRLPNGISRADIRIDFSVAATDPPDTAFFEVGVTDVNGQVRVPVNLTIGEDPRVPAQ